jgi:hypothetical protein
MSKQGEASLSAVPLKLSNAIPQYMDLKSEREFNVLHGNTEYSRTVFSATNPTSSGVNINCMPPSSDSLIHPVAWKKATWTQTFVFSNTNDAVADDPFGTKAASKFCLRAHPLDQIITNEDLKINNNTFQQGRPAQYANAFHRFVNKIDDKVNEYSLTPNQLDEFYNYSDANITGKDPFSNYGNIQIGESRFSFNCDYSTLVSNDWSILQK